MLTDYQNKAKGGWVTVVLCKEKHAMKSLLFSRQTSTDDIARCCLEHWGKGLLEDRGGKLSWVQ